MGSVEWGMKKEVQKDVLEEIVAWKRVEVARYKEVMPEHTLHVMVEELIYASESLPSMRHALMSSDSGIIAEFKRKSPSKGWIRETGKAGEIPLSYQQNGAAALSILTDDRYFGGRDAFIVEARRSGVILPVLYKNFIIDEYQLFQARLCGASAVLLIAADLSIDECRSMMHTAHELGMEVLLEMHSEEELDYMELEPDMSGINNRNLGTFITDVKNSFRLAERLPKGICKVSESGISNPMIVKELRKAGFNGFLIGECFMRTDDPGAALADMVRAITDLS